jgi:hypothetical protein
MFGMVWYMLGNLCFKKIGWAVSLLLLRVNKLNEDIG